MVYLDASAIVKLVKREAESLALRHALASHPDRVSSALSVVEVLRALRRSGAGATILMEAQTVLDRMGLIGIDASILRAAASLGPAGLRSLDAIHLATATSLPVKAPVVTYDHRLAEAAIAAGLPVLSPR